jgi:uncharacterized protein YebE (UPF0316 family)
MLDALFSTSTALAALTIFGLRICDVSLGTLRTISLVQGRTLIAMGLGFFEVLIWIFVIAEVMTAVKDNPILLVAYAAGFAAGNGVGILIDQRIAMGTEVLRIVTSRPETGIADRIRADGQPVTVFHGEGRDGPVKLLYIICRRKAARGFIAEALERDPDLFYVIEPVTGLNRELTGTPHLADWRSPFKKK